MYVWVPQHQSLNVQLSIKSKMDKMESNPNDDIRSKEGLKKKKKLRSKIVTSLKTSNIPFPPKALH